MAKTGYDRSTARLMGAEPDEDIIAAELGEAERKLAETTAERDALRGQLVESNQRLANTQQELLAAREGR